MSRPPVDPPPPHFVPTLTEIVDGPPSGPVPQDDAASAPRPEPSLTPTLDAVRQEAGLQFPRSSMAGRIDRAFDAVARGPRAAGGPQPDLPGGDGSHSSRGEGLVRPVPADGEADVRDWEGALSIPALDDDAIWRTPGEGAGRSREPRLDDWPQQGTAPAVPVPGLDDVVEPRLEETLPPVPDPAPEPLPAPAAGPVDAPTGAAATPLFGGGRLDAGELRGMLPQDLEEQILHRVMQRVDAVLADRIGEVIATVIERQTRSLLPSIREELEFAIRKSVYEAMADELAETVAGTAAKPSV